MLSRPPARYRSSADVRERRRTAQQAYRRRLEEGRMSVSVEIDSDVIEMLIASHWLKDGECEDRAKIGKALGAMVAEAAKR
ncbi:hypothetical protein [Bradyrhizobium sp. F1.13.3]|uniref:hypothetical protein n=1 Tax=Bradyrhizobium sp. F1.13.3 TaxID=3156351 RepID=UPI0033943ECD